MKIHLSYAMKIATFIITCSLILACQSHYNIAKQEVGEMKFSKTINLKLDSLLCSQIKDFFPISESSYVFTDGNCIYKTDSTGLVTKMINNQGHGEKEYIQIGNLYSDGQYVYAWCEMSLYLYKYDMSLNFIEKFKGPNHAIKKFVVTDNDTAYFLLSGGFDEAIGILPLQQKSTPLYRGCYSNEDKALLINSISGGITVYDNQIMYVKPSEMTIWTVGKENAWLFEDKDFIVSPCVGKPNMRTHQEMLDYILSNCTCSGLYADGNDLWLITETGPILKKNNGKLSHDKRFLNLHKINNVGEATLSYMYNYPCNSYEYLICNNKLHLLFNDDNTYTIKQLKL